jgi:hypothetical protein
MNPAVRVRSALRQWAESVRIADGEEVNYGEEQRMKALDDNGPISKAR